MFKGNVKLMLKMICTNGVIGNTNISKKYLCKSNFPQIRFGTITKKTYGIRQNVHIYPPLYNKTVKLSNKYTTLRNSMIAKSVEAEYLLHNMTYMDIFVNSVLYNFIFLHLPTICIYKGMLRFSWSYISFSLLVISFLKTLIELHNYIN